MANSSLADFINSPFRIGSLQLANRLIQGPLAGYSCAPFRALFQEFVPPAYCVSEMCSANDLLTKHKPSSRYLYRAPEEGILAYQIAGNDPKTLAAAALRLEDLGADLIDLNCGCPKTKIRKKGFGSALLETPELLLASIQAIKAAISIPLTIKIRIQGLPADLSLAKAIAAAGADALIVHGRRWVDDYDTVCDFQQIAGIKEAITIPVIANGDIRDLPSLEQARQQAKADAYMVSRAGSGQPWLFQSLLKQESVPITPQERIRLFMVHLTGLAALENEAKAVLQSKSLVRYYFRQLDAETLQPFYLLDSLACIKNWLKDTIFYNYQEKNTGL